MVQGGRKKGGKRKQAGRQSAPQPELPPPTPHQQEAQEEEQETQTERPDSEEGDNGAYDEHSASDGGIVSILASFPRDTSPPVCKPNKKPKKMTDLTVEEEENMALWLEENECFYNKKLNSYRDSQKKSKLWEDKAAELHKDTEMLKVWYRSLRTRYSRLLKKKSGDGAAELTERDQWILVKFSFLKVHVHEVRRRTAVSIKEKLATEDDHGGGDDGNDEEDTYDDPLEVLEAASASSTDTPRTRLDDRPKKYSSSKKPVADDEQVLSEIAARGQQSMAIQEKMLDMLKPIKATERTTYADWAKEVMVDLNPSLWRKFQQEHSQLLYSYLNKNDELQAHSSAQPPDPKQYQPFNKQYLGSQYQGPSQQQYPATYNIWQPPAPIWPSNMQEGTSSSWAAPSTEWGYGQMQRPASLTTLQTITSALEGAANISNPVSDSVDRLGPSLPDANNEKDTCDNDNEK